MLSLIVSLLWGSISFAGTYSCEATYLELDVVKVEVKSTDEFYYCFGYHHGKDRAWMMDYFRRSARGTNAEVLGMDHMKSDLMMRLLNLPGHAERIWQGYSSEEKEKLFSYSRGVNEGFKTGKDAYEFRDAGFSPEEWLPVHTIEVLLLQSFDQTRKTFTSDWDQEKWKARWGDKASTLMDNDGAPWENTILKSGEYVTQKAALIPQNKSKNIIPDLWSPFPEIFGKESGSNNWVVSKNKSASGVAMLANDPHLDLKTPLFWYWVHLKGADEEVMGASLPGVPVVASGTNGKVAWGLTNAYINTADAVFVSDLDEKNLETIRPVVWIKFWFLKLPFFFKSFERTVEGTPVLPLDTQRDERIYLRWTGFNLKASDITPMFSFKSVKNVSEMEEKLKSLGIPSWNFVFADTEGNIGYRVVGNIIRSVGATVFGMQTIPYASLNHYETLSPEERPHLLKPKRGYVYSANNRHLPPDSEINGGRGYSFSFRGNRIDELLQDKQTLESFKRIQCDRQAVDAKYFVPLYLTHIKIPELESWNFDASESGKQVGIYRRLTDLLMIKWEVNEYGLWRLLGEKSEERTKDMQVAYQTALKEISGRPWGEVHKLAFAHLSKNANWKFAPEVGAGGDNHTVDPGTAKWNEDRKVYEHNSGASMRMIIEMEKRPKIHLVLPGFNRDYTMKTEKNPWADWKDCRYTTVTF
ncbi:MAG: penicillin acylase family protein [Bdellovibrionota bacterium]